MIQKIICAIFGHKYVILRVMSKHARKVGCERCKKQWAMHDPTKSFLEWDWEFEEMYSDDHYI